MRFKRTAILAVGVFLMAVPLKAYSQNPEDTFLDKCANCHGKDGAGQTAKGKKLKLHDLRSADVQKMTDAQMADVISKGNKDMDGYAKELNEKQIKDLVAYLRTLAKK